jgi:hypothetical protein
MFLLVRCPRNIPGMSHLDVSGVGSVGADLPEADLPGTVLLLGLGNLYNEVKILHLT